MTDEQIDEMLFEVAGAGSGRKMGEFLPAARTIVRQHLAEPAKPELSGPSSEFAHVEWCKCASCAKPELSERVKLLAMMAAHMYNETLFDKIAVVDEAEQILAEVENRQK